MTQVFQLCRVIVWRRLVSNMITHVGNVSVPRSYLQVSKSSSYTRETFVTHEGRGGEIKIIPYSNRMNWIASKFLTPRFFLFFLFERKRTKDLNIVPPPSFPRIGGGKGFATPSNNKTAINCPLYNVTLCTSAGHLPTPLLLQITFYK